MVEDIEKLITDKDLFNKLSLELEHDRTVELPTRPYKGNCTKEFCEKIMDLYIDREFERMSAVDFPMTRHNEIKDKECVNEWLKLASNSNDNSTKTVSAIVKRFHKSMVKASVGKNLSPYEGWKKIISSKTEFRKFYANRLRCSDWFKEKDHIKYLLVGYVPEFIYGIGLSTSRMYASVTYFKPSLAKHLVKTYLDEYKEVFDPFSGYSGRMLGVLACGKSYVGQDLCQASVEESKEIYEFIKPLIHGSGCQALFGESNTISCKLCIEDTINTTGKYECLLTCSPYENIENWDGVPQLNYTCDKWIDICIGNFECEKYVFVTDDKISKYKRFVKEQIFNNSHFSGNTEYIVVLTKNDRDAILNASNAIYDTAFDTSLINVVDKSMKPFTLTMRSRSKAVGNLGIDIFNIFNGKYFKKEVIIPSAFNSLICEIYDKFEIRHPSFKDINFNDITLCTNKKDVVLAYSGGLDSTNTALLLKENGYNVHLFHVANANRYEGGQSTKAAKMFAEKMGMIFFEAKLSNGDKQWPENPFKNQLFLSAMIDYCIDNKLNQIALGDALKLSWEDSVAGIDVTDCKYVTLNYLKALGQYVHNIEYIEIQGKTSKGVKLENIRKNDCEDLIYSCLTEGRFNNMRHRSAEQKYGIKLAKYNCGCFCRKCAHQNLLRYYDGIVEYPQEFIDKCWTIMYNNGFSSKFSKFNPSIPLSERIENLRD